VHVRGATHNPAAQAAPKVTRAQPAPAKPAPAPAAKVDADGDHDGGGRGRLINVRG